MTVAYFHASIPKFLAMSADAILGQLTQSHVHALEHLQRNAWLDQIDILKVALSDQNDGHLFFEFLIPRMGKRADVVLLLNDCVFVIEFKVGADHFDAAATDQVYDYALDLKNFHFGSHDLPILPVLVATEADRYATQAIWAADGVAEPVLVGSEGLPSALTLLNPQGRCEPPVEVDLWVSSGYRPTPTIIEAAEALYQTHSVEEIARSDAGAKNLQSTAARISEIIERSKREGRKSICFITGVPGAGKTLAGLNIAAKRATAHEDEHAVFLSGNGPLVDVLREALARDQVKREHVKKQDALRSVRRFVQNVHHFRDHYVGNLEVPFEKVVVFDEAQRAWDSAQASKFMQAKRGQKGFDQSEPEFLISVMDRHSDWCTIVCLIGGGQEINVGEAGIAGWLAALKERYPNWDVHASTLLDDPHYTVDAQATSLLSAPSIHKHDDLHLSVSMRSFRAERLSAFVGAVLDNDSHQARTILTELNDRYPIWVTRDLTEAKTWLKATARGTERYGLVASSGAYRLKAEGLNVKAGADPISWFLNDRFDVRSSYYLEDVATEFDVQGLELDWVGVCWDADLRYSDGAWHHHGFRGSNWHSVRSEARQNFLMNTYRVLLTRARQGMVIFVPLGDGTDHTRPPTFYNETYEFLRSCGLSVSPPTPILAKP